MLKNLTTKAKLLLIPIVYIGIVILVAISFTYFDSIAKARIDHSNHTEVFIQQVLKGRIGVYQFLNTPSSQNADKVVDIFKDLEKNVIELRNKLSLKENIETCNRILEESEKYIKHFNILAKEKIESFNNEINEDFNKIKETTSQMAKYGSKLEEELIKINKSTTNLEHKAEQSLQNILTILAIVSIVIFMLFSFFLSRTIISSIQSFKNGLSNFFAYINKESNEAKPLDVNGKDEFAQMAIEINESIEKTKQGLIKDEQTVKEVLSIVEKANKGYLDLSVTNEANNPQLVQLCKALNSMLKGIKGNVDSINDILKEFSNYKFINKIDEKNIEGDIESLVKNVNYLTDEISQLLKNSYVIGLTLDESSDQLIENVNTLSSSSTQAAASLEETAAALEEITSTIVNNADNVESMSKYSSILSDSAKTGQTLAQNTSVAMEEITEQVNSISDAISVIDQIAFQTNILSLNAAVEAATAGEAGKGFAVVAAEVRNLASRSAEAAKEIKELVETATSKAANGKEISSEMIGGYEGLLENIHKSTGKITEIANASKEQQAGITQINDAVTQLDQQTQKNAQIASLTHDIAIETDAIAKELVKDTQSKEFLGKNEAKAREKDIASDNNISNTSTETKVSKPKNNKINENFVPEQNIDEWESF